MKWQSASCQGRTAPDEGSCSPTPQISIQVRVFGAGWWLFATCVDGCFCLWSPCRPVLLLLSYYRGWAQQARHLICSFARLKNLLFGVILAPMSVWKSVRMSTWGCESLLIGIQPASASLHKHVYSESWSERSEASGLVGSLYPAPPPLHQSYKPTRPFSFCFNTEAVYV